jgi:hypothetical protein
MAKKKLTGEPGNLSSMADAVNSLLQKVNKETGVEGFAAVDLYNRIWGLPCDHISYRWLIDNTCYQMGRIFGVAGMKESCKSAYSMGLGKMYLDAGGIVLYLDTENKASVELLMGMCGKEDPEGTEFMLPRAQRLRYARVHDTESWTSHVISFLSNMQEEPYKTILSGVPLLIIIDSLGGVDTRESSNRIEKEGEVNPRNTGGMIKCKSHNEFFRYVNKHLNETPYSIIYVNHLSDDPNSPIQGAKRKPGGTGQDYHAVLDLWFSIVKSPVRKKDYTEKMLKIATNKNSMGTSKRNIHVPYRYVRSEDNRVLDAWFDWDAATAILLADDSPGGVKTRLKSILTVTVNSNKYSCKELGLVQVSDSEMGAAVRSNVELRERISDALGINRMKVWEGLKLENPAIYEQSSYPEITDGSVSQVQENEEVEA